MLRTVIVEDEAGPRERLHRLLRKHADEIEVVGEADNGSLALTVIDSLRPDLVFLDVSLPGADGFTVLDELEASVEVIFTTGSPEHAVRAFNAGALHYLLKPVDPGRLEEAIARAKQPTPLSGSADQAPMSRLLCRDRDTTHVLQLDEIAYLKADQGYTMIQAKQEYLTSDSLGYLEQKLGRGFVRIHRNCLVNVTHVKTLRHPDGEVRLVLRDGVELPVSRRYAQGLRTRLS